MAQRPDRPLHTLLTSHMGRIAMLAVFLCLLALSGVGQVIGKEKSSKKLLYVTHSAGFKHKVLPVSEEIMKQLGADTGHFSVDVTRDVGLINAENLKKYDALMFYTTGELPISGEQKKAFVDFIRTGGAFIGVHSATDTFYEWPEYGRIIGGYFDKHPWTQVVTVRVEDTAHPATKHLGTSFEIKDEIYQFKNYSRENVRVLMTLDTSSVDLNKPNVHRTDGDFATAWCRTYGKGRVFYSALGHFEEVWRDERYRKHIVNGIRWAMGDLEGDATPLPKPKP